MAERVARRPAHVWLWFIGLIFLMLVLWAVMRGMRSTTLESEQEPIPAASEEINIILHDHEPAGAPVKEG